MLLYFDLTDLDSGRGGAELWTLGPLDREEFPELLVEVQVTDSGGMSARHPLVVVADDVNDNPMRPGHKIVHLWKTSVSIPFDYYIEACKVKWYNCIVIKIAVMLIFFTGLHNS